MLIQCYSTPQPDGYRNKQSLIWNFEIRTLELRDRQATECVQTRTSTLRVDVQLIYDSFPEVEVVSKRPLPGGIPTCRTIRLLVFKRASQELLSHYSFLLKGLLIYGCLTLFCTTYTGYAPSNLKLHARRYESFKAQRSLYLPPGLTFKNSTL